MKRAERPLRLVLGGMKHCGKSTIGKALAEHFQIPFADTDWLLEEHFRRETGLALSCREIFRREGEEAFRKREAEGIVQLAQESGCRVTALGGGVPANPWIPQGTLRKLGYFIWLATDVQTAFDRVAAGGLPPFLAQAEDPRAAFESMYRERSAFYRACADLTVPLGNDTPEISFQKVLDALQSDLSYATLPEN